MVEQEILRWLEAGYQNINEDIETGRLPVSFLEVLEGLDTAIEECQMIVRKR